MDKTPAPNYKRRRANGSSHGSDTDSDRTSLTWPGPQPYGGDKHTKSLYSLAEVDQILINIETSAAQQNPSPTYLTYPIIACV
ncbi:MAG: hypothetical protein J07HQX50_02643 [Haloquadratum sp. J07HQX50]|nr:MAG: hypothetical protein J07HQX50_02643 [Haloquadratum sp. J07HQX50]